MEKKLRGKIVMEKCFVFSILFMEWLAALVIVGLLGVAAIDTISRIL